MNEKLSSVSGMVILVIGILCVIEVICRGFFSSPTKWTADFSQYFLLVAIMLAAGFGFQAQGHVRVDMLTRSFKTPVRRVLATISYCICLGFTIVFTYNTWNVFVRAFKSQSVTYAFVQIPRWILLAVILFGCALMIITIISILMSIHGKDEEYI